MNLAAILSIQEKRTVANDYTVRYQSGIYQILPPPQPGLRQGKVTIEQRQDGSLHVRFKGKYLEYRIVEPRGGTVGALPPCPRSLPLEGMPAETVKAKGRTAVTAQPSAVYPARGRSGRTPAEPCLPKDKRKDTSKPRWRPGPDHPWRKRMLLSRK